jgi:hypothetical protein
VSLGLLHFVSIDDLTDQAEETELCSSLGIDLLALI